MKKYICGRCLKPADNHFDNHTCYSNSFAAHFGDKSLIDVLLNLDERLDSKENKESLNDSFIRIEKECALERRVVNLERLLEKECTKCGHTKSVGEQVNNKKRK